MALSATILAGNLTAFFQQIASATATIPLDQLAEGWAESYYQYMALIANPAPSPALLAALVGAKAVMKTAIGTGFATVPSALPSLIAGFTAFVALIPASAAPVIAVPPPAPLIIPLMPPAPGPVGALALASTVHLWTITGTASTPPAAPVPWA